MGLSGLPSSDEPWCERCCKSGKEDVGEWATGTEMPASQAGEGDGVI